MAASVTDAAAVNPIVTKIIVFHNFTLVDEPFVKALQCHKTLLNNNNLWGNN